MPNDPTTPDDQAPRPTMNAEGEIEGRVPRDAPVVQPPEKPLELVERPEKPKTIWEEHGPWRPVGPDGKRRRAVWLAAIAAAIGVLLLGAALIIGRAGPRSGVHESGIIDSLLPSTAEPIVIDSEPDGADVTVNGKVVGQTPWAGENRWAGEAEVVVSKAGFAPWKKKFKGRAETHLKATLKPK